MHLVREPPSMTFSQTTILKTIRELGLALRASLLRPTGGFTETCCYESIPNSLDAAAQRGPGDIQSPCGFDDPYGLELDRNG